MLEIFIWRMPEGCAAEILGYVTDVFGQLSVAFPCHQAIKPLLGYSAMNICSVIAHIFTMKEG